MKDINRAKAILKRVGVIYNRIEERDKAKAAFAEHLMKIRKASSAQDIAKLHGLIELAFQKEREVAMDHMVESQKISELNSVIQKLTERNAILETKLSNLMSYMKDYERMKEHHERRKELIEEKIGRQEKFAKKIQELEAKLKTSKLSEKQKQALKKRIEKIKVF